MSDQNTVLDSGKFKDIGVRDPFELAVGGGSEVNRRLSPQHGHNDSVMDVRVSLESDQDRRSPVRTRAR